MNEFPLLSSSDRKDTYRLNDAVLLSLNEQYTCIGEYPYEKQPIKSHEHSFQISCGELLINKAGLTQISSFLSLLHTWEYLPIILSLAKLFFYY